MSNTTTPTTPTTLLDAVNALLLAIRVSGVNSLALLDANEDSAAAKRALDDVSREVQSEGWEFNREREFAIEADTAGEVHLPSNTLRCHSARYKAGNRLVPRGDRLYDPKLGTFTLSRTAYVDIVLALPFEDLPQPARTYITAEAARRFCLPKLPEGATFRYTEEFLVKARAELERFDADLGDSDLTQTSPHFGFMRRLR